MPGCSCSSYNINLRSVKMPCLAAGSHTPCMLTHVSSCNDSHASYLALAQLARVCAGICPLEAVVCVVVDECHKAVGKFDMVTAIQTMQERSCRFRVLGLSATPGGKRDSVQVQLLPCFYQSSFSLLCCMLGGGLRALYWANTPDSSVRLCRIAMAARFSRQLALQGPSACMHALLCRALTMMIRSLVHQAAGFVLHPRTRRAAQGSSRLGHRLQRSCNAQSSIADVLPVSMTGGADQPDDGLHRVPRRG